LVQEQYLNRIERRIVGGSQGGSGQYVYQLGRKGWALYMTDSQGNGKRYLPSRVVSFHKLAIVDCYLLLRQLERDRVLALAGVSTEPDCHFEVDGTLLRPDLYVEADWQGQRVPIAFEVDLGTETQKQLREKLLDYARAWDRYDEAHWPHGFVRVLWVAVDEARAKELRWVIGRLESDTQKLFRVVELEKLPEVFV
jgi:hypothetical protein